MYQCDEMIEINLLIGNCYYWWLELIFTQSVSPMEQQSSLVVLSSFSLPVVCCVPPPLFLRENSYTIDLQCACIFCLSCPQGSYKKRLIRTGYNSLLFQDPNFASLFLVIAKTGVVHSISRVQCFFCCIFQRLTWETWCWAWNNPKRLYSAQLC